MKKKIQFLVPLFLLVLSGCKKDSEEIKNIEPLFNETNWVGEFKYSGRSVAEPFSIHFYSAGTFTWYELDGEYPGTFVTNNDTKTITLSFSGGSKVTGTVTKENKIKNLTYGAVYPWSINFLEQAPSSLPGTAGTRWAGTKGGRPIFFHFTTSALMNYSETLLGANGVSYEVKHGCLRFTPTSDRKMFGIIRNGEMDGIGWSFMALVPEIYENWKVTKQ